jgi:hypothetical protein
VEGIKNIKYKFALPNLENEIKMVLEKNCIDFNINIINIKDFEYDEAIRHIKRITPYYVTTQNYNSTSSDKILLNEYISGYDCYSLLFLDKFFDEINLYSASFMKHHETIFN